jgi:nucleotide-binding universal stress UspA family protein
MKDILCASDLTPASDIALHYSLHIADRAASQVTLLHVVDNGASQGEAGLVKMSKLTEQVERENGTERVRKLLLEGNFMERIAEESARDHSLVVLGTHGPRGIRQTLFGADILKLVRKLHAPALVVQENTDTENTFDRIVLPVAAHDDIDRLMDAVCSLARLHATEVHVYQLLRPNEQPSEGAGALYGGQRAIDRIQRELRRTHHPLCRTGQGGLYRDHVACLRRSSLHRRRGKGADVDEFTGYPDPLCLSQAEPSVDHVSRGSTAVGCRSPIFV